MTKVNSRLIFTSIDSFNHTLSKNRRLNPFRQVFSSIKSNKAALVHVPSTDQLCPIPTGHAPITDHRRLQHEWQRLQRKNKHKCRLRTWNVQHCVHTQSKRFSKIKFIKFLLFMWKWTDVSMYAIMGTGKSFAVPNPDQWIKNNKKGYPTVFFFGIYKLNCN